MSKSFIGDPVLAEMTEGQTEDSALDRARPEDGPDNVANDSVPSDFRQSIYPRPSSPESVSGTESDNAFATAEPLPEIRDPDNAQKRQDHAARHRFGLPQGFVPRWRRFERTILLEQNIYRLPNDREFIPSPPKGTLGARQHLYALLTLEQYLGNRRGSVYIRSDGRIFDYSVDDAVPGGDLFDTGFTIHDLERTGRYAPVLERKIRKDGPVKHRRAASAG